MVRLKFLVEMSLAKAPSSLREGKQSVIGHKRRQLPGCGSGWAKVLGLHSAGHLKAFCLACDSQKPETEATDSFNRISLQLAGKNNLGTGHLHLIAQMGG